MNNYFLYVGNAYPHKNLTRLIRAVVSLKVNLKIASSRDVFIQRLEKEIKRLDAQRNVTLMGFVPDAKLSKLYKSSVAFVFPSLSEGFGLPGIEAMRAGTLVLASGIPVFKEVYKDNVIYFNPLEVSSIAKAMKSVLEMDPLQRKQAIDKSQKFAKRYSWSKMARETLKVYKSVSG